MLYVERVTGKETIELVCPWGPHSGRIPPPSITFFRSGEADLTYLYMGSKP